jgi:drug/metabolite transporter (DMT)-like permease
MRQPWPLAARSRAGLLVLLAAIVIGLAQMGVEPWLSALLVALLTMGIGYMLTTKGMANLRRTSVAPTQTIETLKETTSWTNRTPA